LNRITIFHYHLLPGGVTNVILLGAKALIRHYPDLELIRLVCGVSENTETIRKLLEIEIKSVSINGTSPEFEIHIEPGISYVKTDSKLPSGEAERMAARLTGLYGDSFWWIHNYQLGKNPLFTAAVLRTALSRPEQKMLLHIHDFPECARYDNLDKLFGAGVVNPYPDTESVAYSLINGRDAVLLEKAGISPEKIFLLNNPVEDTDSEQPPQNRPDAGKLKTGFYEYCSRIFPKIDPGAALVFYPVRTIRRKNALEAGLAAAISEVPVNLVLSLPGVSEREQAYSAACEKCFREGLIPGAWGTGAEYNPAVPSYPEMLGISDMIISSSVQEGFGYLFINSVQLGTPLFARDLDILDGIREIFPKSGTHFYDKIEVPVLDSDAEAVRLEYRRKIESLGNYLSIERLKTLKAEADALGTEGKIDFSYLPVNLQIRILEQIGESGNYKNEVRVINRNLMNRFYNLLEAGKYRTEGVPSQFGLEAHCRKVEEIIGYIYGSGKKPPAGNGDRNETSEEERTVQQFLIDSFAGLQYMRLIYDF